MLLLMAKKLLRVSSPLLEETPPPPSSELPDLCAPPARKKPGSFLETGGISPSRLASLVAFAFVFTGLIGRERSGDEGCAPPPPGSACGGGRLGAKVCGPQTRRGAQGPRLHAGERPFWFFCPSFFFSLSLQPEAERRGGPGGVAARGR
ncbi:hypothetical protein H1C71_000106, partial [Ictidomys tridecemlineatus]